MTNDEGMPKHELDLLLLLMLVLVIEGSEEVREATLNAQRPMKRRENRAK